MDTNSATMVPSDLQAGVTAFAKGKKVTGTGKSFEFAQYGRIRTNVGMIVPNIINVISISSVDYQLQSLLELRNMKTTDFSVTQNVSSVSVDGESYNISVTINDGFITLNCDKSIYLDVFYGKDNYV